SWTLGGASTLTKVGTGTLRLTQDRGSFTGTVAFNCGSLCLSGNGGLYVSGDISVDQGALELDNSNASGGNHFFSDRLADARGVSLHGGVLRVIGNESANS